MSSPQTYLLGQFIASGTCAHVYRAVEAKEGRTVALKKSRVSQRVERAVLRYESRILQLLQGHPAIPAVYGYGQLPHFEYLAMELLGPSIKDRAAGPVAVTTASRTVLQMLSALEHIHKHGFVHRDIKPENVLSSPTDPSKLVLVDFGISRHIRPCPPTRYDPLKESRYIVGTLNWASVNAHNGIDLGPRDDLESLAYIALFLLRGDLPWRISHREPIKTSMRRIHASKEAASGDTLRASFPTQFGYFLDYSRKLEYDQMPDYTALKERFVDLNKQTGGKDEAPLDWSSVGVPIREGYAGPDITGGEEENDEESEEGSEEENFPDSYWGLDIANWEIQDARDRSLTLPIEQAKLADSSVPQIVEVK